MTVLKRGLLADPCGRAARRSAQAVRRVSAEFGRAEAEFALWDMLLRDKSVKEATEVARRIAAKYPENSEVAAFLKKQR